MAAVTGNSPGITIFLCGDVMTGRGIDQILPHPSDPEIFETFMKDARGYVEIAEQVNGFIKRPVGYFYIWGDALKVLDRFKPDLRFINLETSITTSGEYWRGKGINYRMNPANIKCLTSAQIDSCTLANNHVLDWGYKGLSQTLDTLEKAGIKTAGAGNNIDEAAKPVVWNVAGKGRVLIFAYGTSSSGVPENWAADEKKGGINFLENYSEVSIGRIKEAVAGVKQPGDIVLFSIHWGGNWGYTISGVHRDFAHKLIDEAGVDIIHGHSSHHVKGIEVYKNKPVIYGCGDFLNDYEGIEGYEGYRDDLALMYFVTFDPQSAELESIRLVPLKIKNFRLNYASDKDAAWLARILNREGSQLGTKVELHRDNSMSVRWK